MVRKYREYKKIVQHLQKSLLLLYKLPESTEENKLL